jgi:glycosyltransferase involved in cell wall biosynthesis
VLTNHYPSDDDLYRNGFVHSRVAAYAERGVRVDVFRLRKDEALSYHEFHNVDVITGSQEALHKLLSGGHYKSVLVHFLDEAMWQVLQHHIEKIKVFVWVHGAEIQPWHRRDNFDNEQQREGAKIQSVARINFWQKLLKEMPENLRLIFVSQYLAEVVMEDLGFQLLKECYEIIHNPIDTDLFAYNAKPIEQRKKILSIRPYASRTYANDLSVKAILALAEKPYFNELEFRIIGDGKLFEETLEPLRQFSNVYIEQRFLSHAEIAVLHREYGIFLCPTRMDTQGVSRDEAMSSGLVPVTNAVTAIPEFVDESCGILAAGEDAEAMAAGIAALYENPEKFQAMSNAAADRVRRQSASESIVRAELKLLKK